MPLDSEQVTQAVRALYTYLARTSESRPSSTPTPLFDEDPFIYLQLSLKRVPHSPTTKPIPIPLPHPLYTPPVECCLITKDPKPPALPLTPVTRALPLDSPLSLRQYFASHPVPSLTRILPLGRVRREYRQFKDRRDLLALYDVFLCDERIVPLLPAVLGVKFFEKKKQPIPVDLRRGDKRAAVLAALHATYLYLPAGSSLQVRVGRGSFSRQEVCENVMAAMDEVVAHVPGKWGNVQMVGVRAQDSITVPMYSSLPLQALKGKKRKAQGTEEDGEEEAGGEEQDGEGGEDGVDVEADSPTVPLVLSQAAQKRRRTATDEATPPSKKRRASQAAAVPLKPTSASKAVAANGSTPKADASRKPVTASKGATTAYAQAEDEEEEDEITLNDSSADIGAAQPSSRRKRGATSAPALQALGKTAQLKSASSNTTPVKRQVAATPQKKAAAVSLPIASPASGKVREEKVDKVRGGEAGRRVSLPAQRSEKQAGGRVAAAPGSARKAARRS